MSKFHAIYGKGGSTNIVTKFVKTVTISSANKESVTINISNDITNYNEISNDSIIIELAGVSSNAAADSKISHTYDNNTGIITITSTSGSIPFASNSSDSIVLNIYIVGNIQFPPEPPEPQINVTVKGYDYTTEAVSKTLTLIVNVGQMAILSAGVGDSKISLPFASGENANAQGWTISNKKAILGSIRGSSDITSSDDGVSLGCLIVKPTEETGAVSVSRTGGSTTWTGISYILLDLK